MIPNDPQEVARRLRPPGPPNVEACKGGRSRVPTWSGPKGSWRFLRLQFGPWPLPHSNAEGKAAEGRPFTDSGWALLCDERQVAAELGPVALHETMAWELDPVAIATCRATISRIRMATTAYRPNPKPRAMPKTHVAKAGDTIALSSQGHVPK